MARPKAQSEHIPESMAAHSRSETRVAKGPSDLASLHPRHGRFVGIDSDGCVFDSMEIKHRECFCPAFIDSFDLQPFARAAREVWEFVNLRSTTRGVNRFTALVRALDLLARRPELSGHPGAVPRLPGLSAWMASAPSLSNPELRKAADDTGDPGLARVLRWSMDVNEAVSRIVRNVPPFPSVLPALERMAASVDIMVVSQTPAEAIVREWEEHRMGRHVRLVAGQEAGTKADCLRAATSGRYGPSRALMVGDAPGDLAAAREAGMLFCPIVPGFEEESWRRLLDEGLGRFLAGTYSVDYEAGLMAGFTSALPETPPWET